MNVEQVAVGDIRPHPDNPRQGDVDVLMESLRVHGQYKPIVVSEDGVILAGNHTYFAAMELGFPQMDVVRLPFPFDDPRATKVMLIDNRSADKADYANADLARVLQSLDDDFTGTGFTDTDMDDLLALLEEEAPLVLDPNVTTLPNLQEKLVKYQEMGRRMIVLDYSQDEYPRVTRQLEALRERYKAHSNAEAVQKWLADEFQFVS